MATGLQRHEGGASGRLGLAAINQLTASRQREGEVFVENRPGSLTAPLALWLYESADDCVEVNAKLLTEQVEEVPHA
jgi:hypothetical protein